VGLSNFQDAEERMLQPGLFATADTPREVLQDA